jgi:hypothetical protein
MAYRDPLDPRARKARLKHYYANKDQYAERNRTKRAEICKIIEEAKDRPCADCGIKYPYYVMQFDHVRGEKKFGIGAARSCGSVRQILEEIAKCEVVCANCHAERTFTRAEG